MKIVLLILLILFPISINATITGTDRGSGNNNTGSGSLSITPTSNFTANSFGVLCVAVDNSGAAGSNTISPATASDTVGNTWTRRQNNLFDNGAASAGVEIAIYTAPISSLTTGGTITVTWTSTSPTAKAWTLIEFTPSAGKLINYVTGAIGTGSTTGTPTITSGSITSGDVIIGMGGAESADTWTGDADSSNGSWSTHQHNAAGTGATGMSITSQQKIVTGTATQTYNPTLTSADVILGWIQLTEVSAFIPRRVVIIG